MWCEYVYLNVDEWGYGGACIMSVYVCVNMCEVCLCVVHFLGGGSVTSLGFSKFHKLRTEDVKVLGDSEF